MADTVTLQVQPRDVTGKHVRRLRAQGLIPANISGAEKPSVAIQISSTDFTHLLKERHTGVLRLRVGSSAGENALLGRVERDPITSAILHVDFRRVRLNQPVRARIPVHLTGEASAIKDYNGVLLHLLDTIEIEALPTKIPEAVTLDISPLNELNSLLTVADIQPPSGVTVLSAATEPVVTIKPPKIEVPVPEAATEAEVVAPPPTGEASENSANA